MQHERKADEVEKESEREKERERERRCSLTTGQESQIEVGPNVSQNSYGAIVVQGGILICAFPIREAIHTDIKIII